MHILINFVILHVNNRHYYNIINYKNEADVRQ